MTQGGVRGVSCSCLLALLVCALTLIASGCGGKQQTKEQAIARYSQELREAISAEVPDQGRRDQMLLVVDQLAALQARFNRETADFVASYRILNADYRTARPVFDQLFADYGSKRIQARTQALDLHFRLASLASKGEWNRIGDAEVELYEEVKAARMARATQ